MSRRAIILAGGLGTRLKPYTHALPKPLMPVGEYPILEIVIRQLASAGFDRITLAVNHQADIIKAYFQDGSKWGVKIDYSLETKRLGTMGPLHLIDDLPDHFLVMNGDILTDVNYKELFDEHESSTASFTISSSLRESKIDYGVLEVDEKNFLKGFSEKPSQKFQVSMGVYMLSRSICDLIPNDTYFGFDELMLEMLDADLEVAVRPFAGYWLDIGRPDDYETALAVFDDNRNIFFPENGEARV